MALRVLHLVGSADSERLGELSRLYARDCLRATADPARYEPVIAHVEPGGRWRFPDDLGETALATAPELTPAAAIAELAALELDAAVPQMFCRPGMTVYRALLELLDIPYLGNRPDAMALGADKARARALVAAAGVAVPEGAVLAAGEPPPAEPSLPLVVKPVDADNSDGVSLVRDAAELPAAIAAACAHGSAALLERFVPLGREVRCGLLERGGELLVLPLEEYALDPDAKPIRTAADKLARDGDGALTLVAKDAEHAWIVDPRDPVCDAVSAAARRCHRALGCRHYSLFDFRIDPAGRPWFLEAGLYCSFARSSVIATMAGAAGIEIPALFAEVLAEALRSGSRSRERSLA